MEDYEAAVQTNQKAADVDRAYIRQTGAQGIYRMMYYSHNLHFVAVCGAMNGQYAEARKNADLLVANDSTPNYLYINAGGGKFEDESYASGYALNKEGRETDLRRREVHR